jgi:hypothetical protein
LASIDAKLLSIAVPVALSSDEMELGSSGSSLYGKIYVKKPTRASVDFHRALGDFDRFQR